MMSAFIVDKKHIDALCKFARENKMVFQIDDITLDTAKDLNHIGQILVNQNYSSVNYRYREFNEAYVYQFSEEIKTELTCLQIVKACDCYHYQSCETDECEKTVAIKICNMIEQKAIENFIHEDCRKHLEYENALWEICR